MRVYDSALIRIIRERRCLSQAQAANRAGSTLRQWQRWENFEREPKASGLCRICQALAVPPDFLLPPEEENPNAIYDKLRSLKQTLPI